MGQMVTEFCVKNVAICLSHGEVLVSTSVYPPCGYGTLQYSRVQ